MIKEIKDILIYWAREVLEKGFYLLIIIILGLIILYVNNPYGRYFDSWLE